VERGRVRTVAVLLAVVVVAQLAAVVARRRDSGPPASVAIPAGAERVVSNLMLTEGRVLGASVTPDAFRPPAHALYGETGSADPLAGRMLAVGSAFSDGPPVLPTSETPLFRLGDLAGLSVAVGHDRAWTWVTWRLPNCPAMCQGYVAGRNLSEPEVLAAARGANAEVNAPAAGTVPGGMTLLSTTRLDLRDFGAAGSQIVSWLWKGDPLVLRVAPGPDLATLFRFWVDGGPVEVRGRRGSDGELARVGFGGDLAVRAWAEGGRSVFLATTRMLVDDVDEFVASLRGAGAGDWEALRTRVLDVSTASLVDRCSTSGEPFTAVGRSEGRYRWAVGFRAGGAHQVAHCSVLLTPDRSAPAGGASQRPPPRGLSVATTGVTDPAGLFVLGVAPAGSARVRLDLADGRQVDAELAATGPAPGERYYAGFVEGTARRPTVVALNGAGAEIARG
jgi:hypothetical protein